MADTSGAQPARVPTPEFRRAMARFELRKARRLRAEGRPDRAAVALARARLWRKQAGVIAIEAAILMAFLVVALAGGCTTVDNAVRARWPGVTLAEVTVELIDFAAIRITERNATPPAEIAP